MKINKKMFDVIVVGGGAAGLSAALWSGELGFSTLLLEKETEFGGQLLRIYNRIENHLGIIAENGREARDNFLLQIKNPGFSAFLNMEVSKIDFQKKEIILKKDEVLSAKFLIIATGVRRRKLEVEGENSLAGKGILSSGKNEQQTVENKSVLVIGGGDAALENALLLAETAKHVFLLHRRAEFRGRTEFIEKVSQNPKIKICLETVVEKINGTGKVESVEIKNLLTNQKQVLPVEKILIRIGVAPNTEITGGALKLDANGYIEVNQFCETSVTNVLAVGDVANPVSPTISTAVGMGATAAKMIVRCLEK